MDNINRKMMHMKQEKENLNDKVENLTPRSSLLRKSSRPEMRRS